ncbi:MAG: hypothetical protein ABIT58_05505 [Ferruginibacter sp.]
MKLIFTSFLLASTVFLFAQPLKKRESAIRIVNRNFKVYTSTNENVISWKTKVAMRNALTQLQLTLNNKDLPLLINVWMYYDPTDFPTRNLIEPIFKKNKMAALSAVSKRLDQRKEWEKDDKAPYTDLLALKKKLLQ